MQTLASFENNKKIDKALENNPELNTFYLEELFKETKRYEHSFSKFWIENRKTILLSFISAFFLLLPPVFNFANSNGIYLLWLALLLVSVQIFFVNSIILFAKYRGSQEVAFSFVDFLKTIQRKISFHHEPSSKKDKDIVQKEQMMDNIDKMLVFSDIYHHSSLFDIEKDFLFFEHRKHIIAVREANYVNNDNYEKARKNFNCIVSLAWDRLEKHDFANKNTNTVENITEHINNKRKEFLKEFLTSSEK